MPASHLPTDTTMNYTNIAMNYVAIEHHKSNRNRFNRARSGQDVTLQLVRGGIDHGSPLPQIKRPDVIRGDRSKWDRHVGAKQKAKAMNRKFGFDVSQMAINA